MPPLLTLTTDFGEASPYVAAMKGVILSINPDARILDLGHQVPPQNVRHASRFLAASVPFFPPGCIHVVVVDPGVGTERAVLLVEVGGHRIVVPDNGCITDLLRIPGITPTVRRVTEPRYWRHPVSSTFHGRDIFAPVAAHLSKGTDPVTVGPTVETWVTLLLPEPRGVAGGVEGEVAFVDTFGNLISNIPGSLIASPPGDVLLAGRSCMPFRWVRTYGEVNPGETLVLVSSDGFLEVAVAGGSAATRFGLGEGTPLMVRCAS